MSRTLRHLKKPAVWFAILAMLCGGLFAISLWSMHWTASNDALRLSLIQGNLRIWKSQPGDLNFMPSRFMMGGWSGSHMIWTPQFETGAQLYVPDPNGPTYADGSKSYKKIVGADIRLPLLYPFALFTITSGILFVPIVKRAWRTRHNRCLTCGYDLEGLTDRCPECGTALQRLLKRVFAFIMPVYH